MYLFYLLSLFLLMGSLLPNRWQRLYLILSFILLFFLSAYRDVSVGTDTINYETTFSFLEAGYSWFRITMEPGWLFLNDVMVKFGRSFRDLLVLSTILTLLPIFIISYKYSKNPMLSILLYYNFYFYFYSLNITRQLIAVSFALFAIVLLTKKRYILFLIFVAISASLHYSALMIMPLVFVEKIPDQSLKLFAYLILSVIIGMFGIPVISYFISLTGYSFYLVDYSFGNFFGNFLKIFFFNLLFLCIFYTIKLKEIEFKIFFVFLIALNVTARLPFGERLILYISIYQIIFYPYYISLVKRGKVDYKPFAIIMVIVVSYIMLFLNTGNGEIIPYLNTALDLH